MVEKGTFEIRSQFEPPYDEESGVTLGRATFDKQFSGPLSATSKVHLLAARTTVEGSAGYVALERIVGTLDGRSGSFVVAHLGTMTSGAQSLAIRVVPDSGTAELTGISGTMNIQIIAGQHHYEIDYSIASAVRSATAPSAARTA